MSKNLNVTKSSGEKSPFSEQKLRKSLERSGASDDQINSVLKEITLKLFEGISTKQIYKLAFSKLKNNSRHTAARYHLKNAIMELGPSGFPFERFFAEILNCQGYTTKVDQVEQGKCITHEIDIIAEKNNDVSIIECKFHNQAGKFSDVQVPLYIQSRFKDVEEQWLKQTDSKNKSYRAWVVTNTRFSIDATRYGNCAGLNLVAWDYPMNKGIKDLIDSYGLYPITCLTSLTRLEKQRLLDKAIVLCKEIYNNKPILQSAGIKESRITTVMKEAEQLCQHLINVKTTTT